MQSRLVILFLLPVVFNLLVVIGIWLYYSNRRRESDSSTGEGKIYRCENCNLVYVERRLYPVLECPRCQHPNAAIRR
jgi:hypothetical protein